VAEEKYINGKTIHRIFFPYVLQKQKNCVELQTGAIFIYVQAGMHLAFGIIRTLTPERVNQPHSVASSSSMYRERGEDEHYFQT